MKQEEHREATQAERQQHEQRAAVERETTGMHLAFNALQPLDYNARRRAIRWLQEALDNVEAPF